MIEKMQKENRDELKKALEAIDRVGKEFPSIYKLKIDCWNRWWRVDETLKSLQDVARGASMAYYKWWCNSCIDAINSEVEFQKMPKVKVRVIDSGRVIEVTERTAQEFFEMGIAQEA